MEEQIYRFKHHDIEGAMVRILDDEIVSLNEFLPEEHRLDDGDEYEFAYTSCYLRYRGKNVIIDAGFDPDTLPGALEALDILAEDIDLVLLTHGDRDHVVGVLMHDGSLTYPSAQHVMSRELWDHLQLPETLEAMPKDRARFYRALIRALDGRIQLAEEEEEVAEGIHFIANPGHRLGHAIYQFETDGPPLIHSADAFQHAIFAERPDWPNVIDSNPEQAVESRKALVARVAKTNALVLATHTPFPGMGFIRADASGYRWEPATDQEGEDFESSRQESG